MDNMNPHLYANKLRVDNEINELKQHDARTLQEKQLLVSVWNKLKQNPNFFDDQPKALITYNQLLNKHNLPAFHKGMLSDLNTKQKQQQYAPTEQIDAAPLHNGGTPFSTPKASEPAKLQRDIYGHNRQNPRPDVGTSSGLATDYGTKVDQGRQNNGIWLHSLNL